MAKAYSESYRDGCPSLESQIQELRTKNRQLRTENTALREEVRDLEAEAMKVLSDVLCTNTPESWNRAVKFMVKIDNQESTHATPNRENTPLA